MGRYSLKLFIDKETDHWFTSSQYEAIFPKSRFPDSKVDALPVGPQSMGLGMSHGTGYPDHEFILVAWKINEPRTARIAGHVVLSVFGGLGTLTAKGIPSLSA